MARLNPAPLTPKTFSQAVQRVCGMDPDLAHILTILDPPPFRTRKPGFASLIHISLVWQPWRAVAARLLWHYYIETVLKK
jgi:3-methyladenine DNA glycosylase/8-oxoguanine DNA glycosylase